ncbi:hypothetical protein KX816_01710 [Sphingosinicellaceae bacterium]|nr:hypothetical protein KX816_01710 [Sphingosinicellaceae bacterium]
MNVRLRSLLAAARTDLRFGEALGYATEKDMSNLVAAVDDLDRKTSGQQHGTGLRDRLASLFDIARGSSQPHSGRS